MQNYRKYDNLSSFTSKFADVYSMEDESLEIDKAFFILIELFFQTSKKF